MTDEVVTSSRGEPHTTIIERSGGSGAGLLIGFALLVGVVLAAYFLFIQDRNETAKTDAITSAAKSVEKTADKVGDAVTNSTR